MTLVVPLTDAGGVLTPGRLHVGRFPGVIGTFMGRDALSLAMSHLNLGKDDLSLLPAYTCQEVLGSFATQTGVAFYDVRPDLTIDPDDIRIKLSGRRVKMLLVTNYFGFLQPHLHQLKQLCEEHGVALIEDCAHSLLTEGSGVVGDLAIYSFRKVLPVPDGGGLRVNRVTAKPIHAEFHPRIYSDALSLVGIAKSKLNLRTALLSRAVISSQANHVVSSMPSSSRQSRRILPLSHFAEATMAPLSFSDVVRRRRTDFQFWLELSRKNHWLVPIFRDLAPSVCPFGFPANVDQRPLLESRSRRAGIPLRVHWRLARHHASDCRISHQLSATMVTLPLYPDIDLRQRDVLAGILTGDWRRGV